MNKEERRAYNAAYYQRNKDKCNDNSKRWRENNRERSNEISMRSRLKMKFKKGEKDE